MKYIIISILLITIGCSSNQLNKDQKTAEEFLEIIVEKDSIDIQKVLGYMTINE